VGRDGSSWAVRASGGIRKNARRRLCNPQGEHRRRGTGCFGSRVTGACSLPAPVSRKRRVTVGPSYQQARRHAGSCRPVTASSLQVTVARFARGTPRALAALGLKVLIARIVRHLSGCRASRALRRLVHPRAIDGFGPVDPATGRCSALCTRAAEVDALLRQRQCDRGVQTRDLDVSRVLHPPSARGVDRGLECVALLREDETGCLACKLRSATACGGPTIVTRRSAA